MPRATVVIPSHNDAPMLRGCLAALAAQTRLPDEIVVVDNASTDDTAEVGRAAGAVVVAEPTLGVTPASARGYDTATGDLLLRLDADSVPPPDWVERVVAHFEADPELAALSGPGEFYGSTRFVHWIAENCYIGGYRAVVAPLLGHPPLFGSNLAMRRETWLRVRDRVHRTRREVHDDLDLSYAIRPDMKVVWDRTLRVGVSARPFESAKGLWRRVRWAGVTVAVAGENPFTRRAARRRALEEREGPRTANA